MAIPFAPASPKWGFTITAGPAPLACFWLGCASVDSPFHLLADKAVALKLKLSWVLGLPRERFPVLDPPAGLCSSRLGEFPDIPPVSEFHWPLAYTQSTGLFKSRASNSTVSTGTFSRRREGYLGLGGKRRGNSNSKNLRVILLLILKLAALTDTTVNLPRKNYTKSQL